MAQKRRSILQDTCHSITDAQKFPQAYVDKVNDEIATRNRIPEELIALWRETKRTRRKEVIKPDLDALTPEQREFLARRVSVEQYLADVQKFANYLNVKHETIIAKEERRRAKLARAKENVAYVRRNIDDEVKAFL